MTHYSISSSYFSGFAFREEPAPPSAAQAAPQTRNYDLHERTARFGEAILRFVKKMPNNAVNHRLISQLVGAATSLGANYCEADEAVSRKDFCLKISICRKEARETQFFLRMIATTEEHYKEEARSLWREARELHLIFCAILRNSKGKQLQVNTFNIFTSATEPTRCTRCPDEGHGSGASLVFGIWHLVVFPHL